MGNSVNFVSTGQRFGMLTVVSDEITRIRKSSDQPKDVRACRVRCDCGLEKTMSISQVMNGRVTSCGCTRLVYLSRTGRKPSVQPANVI